MSGAPIKFLERQINHEYYRDNKSLETIYNKYSWIDKEEIKKALGVYDLEKESGDKSAVMPMTFFRDWEKICRKLNPKAWEGR